LQFATVSLAVRSNNWCWIAYRCRRRLYLFTAVSNVPSIRINYALCQYAEFIAIPNYFSYCQVIILLTIDIKWHP
jgi:hypothetical protein